MDDKTTEISKSPPMSLNKTDWSKTKKDFIWFSAVPIIAYITAVLALIQAPGHVLGFSDFIPSNSTLVLIVGHIGNTIMNLIRKYVA